ncbi:non-LTR retroelement reverse transcriptase-like, partial [Trifolium medium]|nr:non-LTR retroelement reverse transcriptase-like [Trifolium medium]
LCTSRPSTACSESCSRRVEHFISWKPPPRVGWIRLNTDGSCREDGHIGCGGIIRGSDGEWISGFAKFVGYGNTYLAELWGVVEGLSYARRLNLHRVELHVDSMTVVKAITSSGGGSFRGRSIVDKIWRLIDLDWEVLVHHTYRETNQCADALANMGCNMNDGRVYFDVCPSNISHSFLADALGTTTPRMISL